MQRFHRNEIGHTIGVLDLHEKVTRSILLHCVKGHLAFIVNSGFYFCVFTVITCQRLVAVL